MIVEMEVQKRDQYKKLKEENKYRSPGISTTKIACSGLKADRFPSPKTSGDDHNFDPLLERRFRYRKDLMV
jgi:hypothetical protein